MTPPQMKQETQGLCQARAAWRQPDSPALVQQTQALKSLPAVQAELARGAYMADSAELLIIGCGHAGVEAALAAGRLGQRSILFAMDLEQVAHLPCNPSIGGTAKGQLVREVDALGGVMGQAADACGMQFRMLNRSKGPAVQSPRAQMDRRAYEAWVKAYLENEPAVRLRQDEVVRLFCAPDDKGQLRVLGLGTKQGAIYPCLAVILATGTFLGARIIIGELAFDGAAENSFPAQALAQDLEGWGLKLRRFKTGTPVRVHRNSLNYAVMERQVTDPEPWFFSYANEAAYAQNPDPDTLAQLHPRLSPAGDCFMTWTNARTHQIIQDNLERSPLFSGAIEGTSTRYCPSIEDKIVKFPDKARHQIFVEPVGEASGEMYLQGLSSSLPAEVQTAVLHSVAGLEEAWIQRMGYAIEYACIDPETLDLSLESRQIKGLYLAGQAMGSSGYEEAAALGLMAGANAALALQGKAPFILNRAQAYIGVLIDDLVTRGTPEPYRMMTSRAEYRLILRQDNADSRLMPQAHALGLISDASYASFQAKDRLIQAERARLENHRVRPDDTSDAVLEAAGTSKLKTGQSLAQLLRRPELNYENTAPLDPERPTLPQVIWQTIETDIKYAGYIKLEEERLARFYQQENQRLPQGVDYTQISGLKREAQQKLTERQPRSVGQASRIPGVTPADISVLLVRLEARRRSEAP